MEKISARMIFPPPWRAGRTDGAVVTSPAEIGETPGTREDYEGRQRLQQPKTEKRTDVAGSIGQSGRDGAWKAESCRGRRPSMDLEAIQGCHS